MVGANAPIKFKILLIIDLFSPCKHPLILTLNTHKHLEEVVLHPTTFLLASSLCGVLRC
jgi:hypothetical protein